MSTNKITKNLLEAVNSVLTGQSLKEAAYIDKKNHKASNIGQLEDLIAAELDLGGVDDEDLKNLLTHFKKGYSIAVAVGAADKRELKKDGYVPGPFAIYKDMDERNQEIYIKAPMKESSEESTEDLEEAAKSLTPEQSKFIKDFDEEHQISAKDWLSPEKIDKLMKLVNDKKKFMGILYETSKKNKGQIITKWESKGWKLFASDVKGNILQFIFVK